jgi:tetratricopeptide (TPR) repeat protein
MSGFVVKNPRNFVTKLMSCALVPCLTLVPVACTGTSDKKNPEPVSGNPGVIRRSFVLPFGGNAAVWNDAKGFPEAFALLEKGDYEGAEKAARAQLAKSPADPQALLALSASLLMSRNIELADYYATRLANLGTVEQSSAKNIHGIARMLFGVGTGRNEYLDEAANTFREALASSGNQVAAALNLGELELTRGRAGESIAAFEQAAQRCDECRPALYGRGMAALRARQFDLARDSFRTLVKRDDKDDEAHYQLAVTEYYGFQEVDAASRRLKDLATGSKDSRIRPMAESLLRKLRAPEEKK